MASSGEATGANIYSQTDWFLEGWGDGSCGYFFQQ